MRTLLRSSRAVVLPLLFLVACGTDLDLGDPPGGAADTPPPGGGGSGTLPTPNAPDRFAEEAAALGARWTWVDPLPTGEPMMAAAGTTMSDLVYAGAGGTVLRWSGGAWKELTTNHDVTLDVAWAPSPGVAWVGGLDHTGRGRLFVVQGGTATESVEFAGFPVQTLTGLGPTRAWAAGPRGEVRTWDGSAWSTIRQPSPTSNWLRGLHGFSATDVWGVGDRGEIVHYDGASWSTPPWSGAGTNPFDADLGYEGVWGAAPNDVWAVAVHHTTRKLPSGAGGQYLPVFSHYDGTRWSVVAEPSDVCGDDTPFKAITGSWNPWGRLDTRRPYGSVIAGTDAANVLFHRDSMCAWHFDGAAWRAEPFALDDTLDGGRGVYWRTDNRVQPAVVALAQRTLVTGSVRFEPSAPTQTSTFGQTIADSKRWLTLLPGIRWHSSVTLSESGEVWASAGRPEEWTAGGWSLLPAPPSVPYVGGPAMSVRNRADVWAGPVFGYTDPGAAYLLRRDAMSSRFVRLDTEMPADWPPRNQVRVEALKNGGTKAFTLGRGALHSGARFLWRLGAGGVEARAEVEGSLGYGLGPDRFGLYPSGIGGILPDPSGDRVLFAYAVLKDAPMAECVVGAWDGTNAPTLEVLVPNCSGPIVVSGNAVDHVVADLHRLDDGRVVLQLPNAFYTIDLAAKTATRHLTIETTPGVVTVKSNATSSAAPTNSTAAFTNATTDGYNVPEVGGLASAGKGRYWIVAGGGLFLWDAKTDQVAVARHASGITSIVANAAGEAWAVGPGLLHYAPPPPSSTGSR